MNYSIGHLSGVVKPKYRAISTILGENFNPVNGLDIFIDLNELVLSASSSKKYMQAIPFSDDVGLDITVTLLQIFKHWKDYSRKYENVRVFMICNDLDIEYMYERTKLKSYMVPFVNRFEADAFKMFKYYWKESIKLVTTILNYVPGGFMINCEKCDSYIIPNIIDDYSKNNRERIIVSGSSIMTNYHYMKKCHIIYSRYKFTGMVQLSDPIMIIQNMTKVDDDIISTFAQNKVFFNVLNAIVGDKNRGLIGLTQLGITTFAETLLRAVERRDIPSNPKNIESVLTCVDNKFHDYLRQSYDLIDIEAHSSIIPQSHIESILKKAVDLPPDIDGLKSITISGLNLLELL